MTQDFKVSTPGEGSVRVSYTTTASTQLPRTCAAVCKLYGVCQVRGGVHVVIAVPVAVVPHQLGVHVDGGHIVHNARDLLCRVLQDVAQQRSLP